MSLIIKDAKKCQKEVDTFYLGWHRNRKVIYCTTVDKNVIQFVQYPKMKQICHYFQDQADFMADFA